MVAKAAAVMGFDGGERDAGGERGVKRDRVRDWMRDWVRDWVWIG